MSELEAERALVEANRELAARFEQKLHSRLAAIWGETPGSDAKRKVMDERCVGVLPIGSASGQTQKI